MKYTEERFSFTSSNGKNTVQGYIYTPKGEAAAVIQLSHGMCDYIGRYLPLIEALTDAGYAVAGSDHIGHGASVADENEYGYFGKRGEVSMRDDLYRVTQEIRARFEGKKIILVGHSMGSFIARMYAIQYGEEIDGAVFLGTSGPVGAVHAGKLICKLIELFRGDRYRSQFVKNLAFSGYNKKFGEGASPSAWVTSDEEMLEKYEGDPLCSFTFTVSAYHAMFSALGSVNCRYWIDNYPKSLPTLIASGGMDPVGAYGKGPQMVADWLREERCNDVTLRIFKHMRHELHNEARREKFFAYLVQWLDERYK